ncbi:hypothetical protein F5X98DRAFT_381710 [Xylaria grammica]|nr:hypothetical protein F5X98DRAFT_381710 [Xylaria grammica]
MKTNTSRPPASFPSHISQPTSSAIKHRMVKNELFMAKPICSKGSSIASELPILVKASDACSSCYQTGHRPALQQRYPSSCNNGINNDTHAKEESAEYDNNEDDAGEDKDANYHSASPKENEIDRISYVRELRDRTKYECWVARVRAGMARIEPVGFKPVVATSLGLDAANNYNIDETKNQNKDMAHVVHHKGVFKPEEMRNDEVHADIGKMLGDTPVPNAKTLSRKNFAKHTALESVRSIARDASYGTDKTIAMHSTADLPVPSVKSAEQAPLNDHLYQTYARKFNTYDS